MSAHEPVLLREVMDLLALRPDDDAIDCTFGDGGYAEAMLRAVGPTGRILALDRDPDAIERGRALEWVRAAGERLTLVHANFADLRAVADRYGLQSPHGITADLGCSSPQLAASDRGFSFQQSGPLDMRFDPTSGTPTAADLLRTTPEWEIAHILRRYGEDPAAARIARAIVAARRQRSLRTTRDLVEVIAAVRPRRGRLHPATRTFQALRIAVNDELGAIERVVPQMLEIVAVGGRVAIISFHSLEDRIVKRAFLTAAAQGGGAIITKRPVRPSAADIERNPRSRSAKLRIFERRS